MKRRKGAKLPAWYLDCPRMAPGSEAIVAAFWDLSGERRMSANSLGRIPWSAARLYAQHELGLDASGWRVFKRCIRRLDDAYLEWQRAEYEAAKASQDAAAKRSSRRRGSPARPAMRKA